MRIAFFNGCLGTFLCLIVGPYLGWDLSEVLMAIGVSVISGFIALCTTIRVEKRPWFQKWFPHRAFKTWTVLLTIYGGLLWVFLPKLNDLKSMPLVIFPLILATGFAIMVFGPLQDYWNKKAAKK